jgi:UPF0271 protein
MKRTVALATAHNVSIGAHPGFADRKNFGRTEMNLSPQEIQDLIATQVSLLKKIADGFGASDQAHKTTWCIV